MITAAIVTIGDEILIGQVVDTNSSALAQALQAEGIAIREMISVGDEAGTITETLTRALSRNAVVITTGGLGPTKDDITKKVLLQLSGSRGMVVHPGQLEQVHRFLKSRGLDALPSNLAQAEVPDKAEVIVNQLGTAPIMVFRNILGGTLYSLPGVPHEAVGAIPAVMADVRSHQPLDTIRHRNVMVYGIAESALSERIAPWEDALPADMHLAYLPHQLTGIRLRLSASGGEPDALERRMESQIKALKSLLGPLVYADIDTNLETVVGGLLKASGRTLSVAESCTGGEIAHLLTTVSGSSAYFLGSVTSYARSVKEKLLGVPAELIDRHGLVSGEVAAAMAEGVRKLTGSDYAVATTGLAEKEADEWGVPGGTVWIGVASERVTRCFTFNYRNDRKRNIERFAASALNCLRLLLEEDAKIR